MMKQLHFLDQGNYQVSFWRGDAADSGYYMVGFSKAKIHDPGATVVLHDGTDYQYASAVWNDAVNWLMLEDPEGNLKENDVALMGQIADRFGVYLDTGNSLATKIHFETQISLEAIPTWGMF